MVPTDLTQSSGARVLLGEGTVTLSALTWGGGALRTLKEALCDPFLVLFGG